MILAYQDIVERCDFNLGVIGKRTWAARDDNGNAMPMIVPFHAEKVVVNGKSAGCSTNSYDVCIDHDLVLGPNPGSVALDILKKLVDNPWSMESRKKDIIKCLSEVVPHTALAYTVEDFWMPDDVCATVVDKSSFARVFVSAFNTMMDAGFCGNLTLELVNFSDKEVVYKQGDPVCQIMFHQLTNPTRRPYRGKYQHQSKAAHPARYEEGNG